MKLGLLGIFALTSLNCMAKTSVSPPTPPTKTYPPIYDRNGRSGKPGADFNVDYLYWTARQDGLEYAFSGSSNNATSNAEPGEIYHPDANWESGYKIGLAAYTAYDGWDLQGLYTWFKNSTHGSVYNKTNLKRTWQITNVNTPSTLSYASCNWSLSFNTFDLLLRRKFLLSPKFIIQPQCGFKFAWLKQLYMVTYDGLTGNTSGSMQIKQKSEAAGIEGAIASNWYFTDHVSLFARFGASILWFDTRPHRVDTSENGDTIYTTLNTKEKLSYAAPELETFLGFSYESSLYKKKIQAIFQVGYEFQVWFDMNQFARTILDANGSIGNLNLQGLTVRGQIEF